MYLIVKITGGVYADDPWCLKSFARLIKTENLRAPLSKKQKESRGYKGNMRDIKGKKQICANVERAFKAKALTASDFILPLEKVNTKIFSNHE